MLDKLIIGAVRGAIGEVVPQVARQAETAVQQAHDRPPASTLPQSVERPIDLDQVEALMLDRLMRRPEFQAIKAETASIPWYKSQVVVGGLTVLAAPAIEWIAGKTGLATPELNSWLAELIAFVGGSIVMYGRVVKGTAQPVTLTARRAESDGPDAIDMG